MGLPAKSERELRAGQRLVFQVGENDLLTQNPFAFCEQHK